MVPQNFEDWFAVSERVEHDRKVGGVRNHGGKLVLGWKAGPSEPELNILAHEMAHMIEIPHHRVWWNFGWGLGSREVEVYGKICREPLSDTGTLREIRVVAIQWMLQEHFGVETLQVTAGHIWDIVDSLKYVYDHFNYTYQRPSLKKIPYRYQEGAATRRAIRDVMRYKRGLDITSLWKRWCEKCDVLEHVLD